MDSSRDSGKSILPNGFRAILFYALLGLIVGAAVTGAVTYDPGNDVETQGLIPLVAPDGMQVNTYSTTYFNQTMTENYPTSGTVDVATEEGNISFFSSGDANATIRPEDIAGTWTNVTHLTADPNAITITPEDKDAFVVGNEIDNISVYETLAVDDSTVDFVYGGSTGQSRVTVQGLVADTTIYAVDADTNNILDYAESDGNGQVTFDALDNSKHAVQLTTNENNPPSLTNFNPTGNVDSPPSTIEVDVNDTNFDQGDSVTAELFVDGTSQGADTLSSNGTASIAFNADLGETYHYYWNVSDSFGAYTNSSTKTFSTPSNITIRQETNASKIVKGVNATLTFYSADATVVVERSDDNDDGNISLDGLPDKEFVAVVEADGYYDRRVYIESIYEQQNIFILNNTNVPPSNAINTTFVFEDRTAEFPPENTTLRIQRALDVNNDDEFEWMTVAGDFWGAASEFPFTGEQNARYRLIVENAKGDRRVLGTHIPTESGVKTIINGQIRFEADNATGRYFDASLSADANNIQVLYQDPTNSTGDVRVRVWELGNQSNEIHDQNYTNSPYGRLLTTVSITDEQAEESWVIRIDGQTDGGENVELQVTVGSGLGIALPMDPWLLAALSVIGITFVGSLYGPRTATLGSWVLVAAATGLTAFGFIGIPYIALVVAAVIAAGGTFYSEALP